jgi:hypothetical protein
MRSLLSAFAAGLALQLTFPLENDLVELVRNVCFCVFLVLVLERRRT